MAENDGLYLGIAKLNDRGYNCCGKPRGCRMTHDGCAYLRHPWKRAMVFGDATARCQATWHQEGAAVQCGLNHGHAGACDPALAPSRCCATDG